MEKALNWVPITGKHRIEKGTIEYVPSVIEEGPNKGQYQICMMKSNIWFESGTINFDVTISNSLSGAQVVLNHGHPIEIFIGIGAGGAFGIGSWSNNRYEALTTAGDVEVAPSKYNVEIQVIGSHIKLLINGVSVCNTIANISKCQPAIFMRGEEKIIIENIHIASNPIKAFVVMQFTPEFNDLYAEVIKPTVESFKIDCVRADDIYSSDSILTDITQSIIESSFIVADITPDNPNVFYEVGYAHAIKKPVILLSDNRRDKLPFDISGFRVILYENSIGGKTKVEERLKKHINLILNG
ncbi:MAG: hypothetical protein JRI86_09430 [Deltaproteobacteria bacterium]|nr:hypothetical protein [Deltaproteobacteria bacterium]